MRLFLIIAAALVICSVSSLSQSLLDGQILVGGDKFHLTFEVPIFALECTFPYFQS